MDEQLELTGRAEAAHFWFHGFRAFVVPVLARLAAGRTDLRAIDCGCGTGHNLALLRPYARAVGFDLILTALARSRAAGTPMVYGDMTRIPFASNTFDIATSFDVLQHVEADDAAVREVARVVKPGGAVVCSVAALEMLRGDHSESWQELRRYTPGRLRTLFEQAGLRPERIAFMFGSLFPLMYGARVVQRALRPWRTLRHDRDIRVPAAPVNDALTRLVRTEAALAPRWSLPFGSSLLIVGRKEQ